MSVEGQSGPGSKALILNQVREAYGRASYTHKTQEKQADIYAESYKRQQWLMIVLTALGSGTFLAALIGILANGEWAALVTSFVAVLVSAINLGTKTFKYGTLTQQHRDTAAEVWNLRESYLSLIVDIEASAVTLDQARERRDVLQNEASTFMRLRRGPRRRLTCAPRAR